LAAQRQALGQRKRATDQCPGGVESKGAELANTPEELIERVIGWPMPASLLRWWVVGVADQGQLLSVDNDGRP